VARSLALAGGLLLGLLSLDHRRAGALLAGGPGEDNC